ncbi:DUF5131 family protein [Streptomyces ipomoeae]|nr:DUF5131 family protein [Streptomyces ipomoeae]
MIGCTRVSEGCDGCYAIDTSRIRTFNPNEKISTAYAGTTHKVDGRVDWTGQVNLLEDRLLQPMSGKGIWRTPQKVFVNSQSDLFHEEVPDTFVARILAVMVCTPQHTYQVLTKRHGRMRSLLSKKEFAAAVYAEAAELGGPASGPWPLPNLWMGVSVESQQWANTRIPALLATPAAVRFVSAEPLLGPVDLTRIPYRGDVPYVLDTLTGRYGEREPHTSFWYGMAGLEPIDWVIVGGESGRRPRPMPLDWARDLRDQCLNSRRPVAFFFKQTGSVTARELGLPGKGDDPELWPQEFRIQQFPTPKSPESAR